jgi:hypothetical protein
MVYGPELMSFRPPAWEHLQPGWTKGLWLEFTDPTDSVINEFNKAMLRGSAMVGDTTQIQTVNAVQTITQNVFRSDFPWFVGGAILQIAIVLMVLPMFYGYWMLRSDLTLSPFSTALALDAPLLRDANASQNLRGVVEELGNTRIKLERPFANELGSFCTMGRPKLQSIPPF